MSNGSKDRGMMKWMPYQSLIEQGSALARMRYEKSKSPRPHIARERAEEINEIIAHYARERVRARYWEDGYLYRIEGTIDDICVYSRCLRIHGKTIPFANLIELQRI